MKLINSILTKNDCYKTNRKITVKGLMIHSVGCSQPSAMAFIKQWDKPKVEKCVHAFVEPNGDVYQTLPWNHRGWHGGGSSNNTHIGVEMTEPSTIKYTGGSSWTDLNPAKTKEHVMATYKASVELFAFLCKEFRLNPLESGVIISHSEGCKLGIASNHGDVEHIWRKFGLTMDQFRKDVNNKLNKKPQERQPETKKESFFISQPNLNKMIALGIMVTPDYWKNISLQYLNELCENSVKNASAKIDNGIKDVNTAINVLVDAKVINTAEYWINQVNALKYLDQLIINMANKNLIVLQKIVHAEACGESEKGQILVANVIFNRVKSKGFPNGLYDVVFQPMQFQPTRDGAYNRAVPSEKVKVAVQKAINGEDCSQGALYFRTIKGAEGSWHEQSLVKLFDCGTHRFYK